MSIRGTIFGVGLGPGDVELMSVKAHRLVRGAKHVAFFRKAGKPGHARKIVDGLLADNVTEFAMEYPVTTEIPLTDPRYNEMLSEFYETCCAHIMSLCDAGEDVVILCEGDPFFYGSFMHIYNRVRDSYAVDVVPAITGMSAAWTATGTPITWGDDILTVLMGTADVSLLRDQLAQTNAAVIMKIGQNLPKIRQAIEQAGHSDKAYIVEYAAMANQTVQLLSDYQKERAPYFSIVIIHGQGRRP